MRHKTDSQKGMNKMRIMSIYDDAFCKYGKVVHNIEFAQLVEELKKTPVPEAVVYEPSVEVLEATAAMEQLSRVFYGEMPIQIGYCNGHNSLLNAVEYHRSSEINVAATDAILLVGLEKDIEDDFTYDTGKIEAFMLPAGCAVELYATTLHYAPCGVRGEGFQVAIVLPKGTNYPLKEKHIKAADAEGMNEDMLITATNKWLIGHEEGGFADGEFIGLKGKNLNVNE